MSRARRMFVIASLIVFGLLAPAPSEAVLQHCSGPWSGPNDNFVSTCRFKLGGGTIAVAGLAVGATPMSKVDVKLYRYPISLYPNPVAECSGAGSMVAQCSGPDNVTVPPTQYEMICVVKGAAVVGLFSCTTV